ncbi:glycosyltransferase [Sulfurimonas sp.]
MNICGTIVLYNPTDEIFLNIDSYINAIDKLIVVDNSEIQNKEIIDQLKAKYTNYIYINNNDNLGIATALNIACDKAIELGYEWILTMDQDSRFINFNAYLECLSNIKEKENISLLCANHKLIGEVDEKSICHSRYMDFVITSGCFLNLSLFNTIGRFNDELFIDEVDHDYCARSNILNYKIIELLNIKLEHLIGYNKNNVAQHNYIRTYYITRNILYMSKKYGNFFQQYRYRRIIYTYVYRQFFRILRKEEDKFRKLHYLFLGVIDFIKNKYGKKT